MKITLTYPPAAHRCYYIKTTYLRRGSRANTTRTVGICRRQGDAWVASLRGTATVTAPDFARLKVRIGTHFFEHGKWWR